MSKVLLTISFLFIFLCLVQGKSGDAATAAKLNNLKTNGVVAAFISVNGYSNNLYIDNVTLGNQFDIDVAAGAVNNIPADTSYAIGADPFTVAPNITVANVGRNDVSSPFDVILEVMPGAYSSTRTISSLNQGQAVEVSFDDLQITPGNSINISVYTTLSGDQNAANDTLHQYSAIFPGMQRNVLVEEWTSATCGPCASNNPAVDAFITSQFDSLVAIKYHVGWPSPGNDPMYLYNTTQSYDRRYYYGVNAVPTVIMDGVSNPVYPYTTAGSLTNAFNGRMAIGTPLTLSVTDTHMPGDSVQSDIHLEIVAPMKAGDYYLRVSAVERVVEYTTPPGSNGETTFYDVFRHSYPTSAGVPIPTAPGAYDFVYKYHIDTTTWVDSMIYTAAFVQNDANREVVNCGKGRDVVLAAKSQSTPISSLNKKDRSFAEAPISAKPLEKLHGGNEIESGFNYELFESAFPPAGWRLSNPDQSITFAQYSGANGPSFGGSKSIFMDFYSYGSQGEQDTLFTRPFIGLEPTDTLKFDYAYAMYPGYTDRLIVLLSTDGGQTFPYTIFDKSGADLATAPNTTNPFVPTGTQWQTFSYSLENVLTGINSRPQVITHLRLAQNYPNPFNPSTAIQFNLPAAENVELAVFNTLGEKVTVLVNGHQQAGPHQVTWNGTNQYGAPVASGVYFYRLRTEHSTLQKKMLYLK